MLKETETEETVNFFIPFLSLVAFQLGGWAPCPPSWLRLWHEQHYMKSATIFSFFQLVRVQRKMGNIFFFSNSKAQRNFCNELFDSVEA